MRFGCLVLAVLASCYRDAVVEPPAQPKPVRLDPVPLTAPFAVTVAELGDEGVLPRLAHRTRLARLGRVRFRLGSEPIDKLESDQESLRLERTYPVIEQTETHIRIVLSDPHTIYTLWVEASDTHETLLAHVRLLPNASARYEHAAIGAWLAPGAPVTVGRLARRRHVRLRDDRLEVAGFVDERIVGRVWVELDHRNISLSWDGASEPYGRRPSDDDRALVPAATRIHTAPDANSAVVAVVKLQVPAFRLAKVGAWTEVDIPRGYGHVRGFVRIPDDVQQQARIVVTDTSLTINPGSRFPVEIPAGTCLFDAVDGMAVGVATQTVNRLAVKTTKPDWLDLHHHTPWGDTVVFVRSTNADPDQPAWQTCPR